MRFGKRREAAFVLCAAVGLGMSLGATARGDGWRLHSTLPGEVPAYDFNTGGEYFAPPVPYGHYAKDPLGQAAKGVGHVKGSLMGAASHFGGKLHGLGHGAGCGEGCGRGDGGCLGSHSGLGHGAGGAGCGFCSGLGLFKHGSGMGAGLAGDGCGALAAAGPGFGGHRKSYAPYHPAGVVATGQALPAGQAVVQPSAQVDCGQAGCGLGGLHSHLGGLASKLRCRLCGGNGCGPCGGSGFGDPCSGCHGAGHGLKGLCGSCGGCGLLSGLGHGGGNGCQNCGGAGCKQCLKGLGSKLHGLLKSPMGLLHHQKYDWFVGAGGPVPLTPGYVPYIVTTRSPRDYFAFPPMSPDAP